MRRVTVKDNNNTTDNGAMPTVERSAPTGVDPQSVEFTPRKVHAVIKMLKVAAPAVLMASRHCSLRKLLTVS